MPNSPSDSPWAGLQAKNTKPADRANRHQAFDHLYKEYQMTGSNCTYKPIKTELQLKNLKPADQRHRKTYR